MRPVPKTAGNAPSFAPVPDACPLPDPPDPEESAAWERALERGVCLHCEGELGRGWKEEDGPFCCRGCRSVYELIHGSDLSRYYDLRRGRHAPAAVLRPDTHAWLDQLLARREEAGEAGALRLALDIQGVHCAACVWLLEELYRREPAGLELRINPSQGRVDLSWDPERGDLRHYLSEVERFGYRLGPRREGGPRPSRDLLARMAVSIAVALNVMMFTLSFYFGLAPEDGTLFHFFGWLNLGLASVAVIVGGKVFFRGALAGLRRRVAHLDLPISVGIALAYAGSVYAFFAHGPRAAYFDTLTVFVALMLIGRWAQENILERNRNALLDSAGAEHLVAKRQRGGRIEALPATEIRRGDEIWIAPGDLVPVAGILLRRPAEVSLDWITGESEQASYAPGDTVPAGAFNAGRGGFTVAASQDFSESRLVDLLRSAPGGGEPYRPGWWSRIAGVYVGAVLVLALLGFLLWAQHDARRALEVTVAVLVITCPCALGLATPLAEELIHVALRRRGVFLRKPDFLDKALAVRKVLLDKTGTLTIGSLALEPESRKSLWRLGEEEKLVLWNLTARSNHPVSRCLADALRGFAPPSEEKDGAAAIRLDPASEELAEIPGQGLEWRQGKHVYRLGRPAFALGGAVDPVDARDEGGDEAERETLFTRDGRTLVACRFREDFKADAAAELAQLREEGYELHLLSGDARGKVLRAAEALEIPPSQASGGLSPEQKAERVRALDEHDTLMVGDGLNDSPSFEAALCAATPAVDRPVLPGKADFYFLGDGIAALRRALLAARRLRRVVRDNLVLAVAYNLLAVGLCFAGLVTPVVAAILMPLSSVGVVTLTALRLSGRRQAWMS